LQLQNSTWERIQKLYKGLFGPIFDSIIISAEVCSTSLEFRCYSAVTCRDIPLLIRCYFSRFCEFGGKFENFASVMENSLYFSLFLPICPKSR
jgi:hypothetical protein